MMSAAPKTEAAEAHNKSTADYKLREARLSDLSSIARVWHRAFFDDEIIGEIMHPHRQQYPEDVYWFLLRGIRERFWDWRHQFMVAVTTNDQDVETVVGAADWQRLGDGGTQRELFRLDPRELTESADLELLLIGYRKLDSTSCSCLP